MKVRGLLILALSCLFINHGRASANDSSTCDDYKENITEYSLDTDENILTSIDNIKATLTQCKKMRQIALYTNQSTAVATVSTKIDILKQHLNTIRAMLLVKRESFVVDANAAISQIDNIKAQSEAIKQLIDEGKSLTAQLGQSETKKLSKSLNLPSDELLILNKKAYEHELTNLDSKDTDVSSLVSFANQKIKSLESISSGLQRIDTTPQGEDNVSNSEATTADFKIPAFTNEALLYQFYTGFEYNEVNNLFSDNSFRFGLQTYFKPGKSVSKLKAFQNQSNDCNKDCGFESNWFSNPPHFIVNLSLTGASESEPLAQGNDSSTGSDETEPEGDPSGNGGEDQVPPNEGDGGDGDGERASPDEGQTPNPLDAPDRRLGDSDFDAVEFEVAIFYPLYIGSRGTALDKNYQEFAFGLIGSYGGRKVDNLDALQQRHYYGVRFAFNEETYFDAMLGKSDPLEGDRLQLRGQLPVAAIGGGRVFLGTQVNLEVSKKKQNENNELISEPDSIKVWVTWQTTFDKIFGSAS